MVQWYSMVLNGIQWYSMVFNGIPLALFCKGLRDGLDQGDGAGVHHSQGDRLPQTRPGVGGESLQ